MWSDAGDQIESRALGSVGALPTGHLKLEDLGSTHEVRDERILNERIIVETTNIIFAQQFINFFQFLKL